MRLYIELQVEMKRNKYAWHTKGQKDCQHIVNKHRALTAGTDQLRFGPMPLWYPFSNGTILKRKLRLSTTVSISEQLKKSKNMSSTAKTTKSKKSKKKSNICGMNESCAVRTLDTCQIAVDLLVGSIVESANGTVIKLNWFLANETAQKGLRLSISAMKWVKWNTVGLRSKNFLAKINEN